MLGIQDHETDSRPRKRPRTHKAVEHETVVTGSIMKKEEETESDPEEIMACDHLSLSFLTANCCVQSDSAFSMTSSTSRLSDPNTCDLIIACKCRCHDARSHNDELGYLLEASDEELGIPTEIHDVGACEVNGLFSDLQNLEVAHAWNGGHENSVCIEEVGDLDVWEIGAGGHSDVNGIGETSEADNCFLNYLEHGSPVYTIV